MQPQKFEKEVQRKMDDLEFVPSTAVWENVLLNITPRRRRRMVAAWWWLGPGLLALGAGGALVLRTHARTDIALNGTAGKAGHAVAAVAGGKAAATRRAGLGTFSESGAASAGGDIGTGADRDGSGTRTAGAYAYRENITASGQTAPGANGTAETAGLPDATRALDRRPVARFRPGLIDGFAGLFGVRAPDMPSGPVKPAVTGISQSNRPWRAGFVAGGGVASVEGLGSAALYGSIANRNGPNSLSLAPQAPGPVSAASAKRYSARIRPDISYRMGVFGEKGLSSRWTVDIGLDLHYYAVQLLAEQQAGGNWPSSVSLFQQTSITYFSFGQSSVPSMSDQTYINKYFFLEMPVAAQWRINHSSVLPVFWRGGAILSYLMASNAVSYDSKSGTLSGDKGMTRRSQASLTTGLMVGFPFGGVEFQAGPEIQYAVTGLQNRTASAGHLVYGGMRIAIMR